MNKARITNRAHAVVYNLIQHWFDVGHPFNEMGDENPDAEKLRAAVEKIQLKYCGGEIKDRSARRKEERNNAS